MADITEKKRGVIASLLEKVKLVDAGEKMSSSMEACSPVKSSMMDYPRLYLTSVQAPDLKKYDVGDEIVLVVKGKITSHDLNESSENHRESFSVQINKIACGE